MTEVLSDPAPVTARRALTRDRLMAAAVTVFAERGIAGASVEEICETAGFTRGAFYSNFTDKDGLVLALIAQDSQTQYAATEQAVEAMRNTPPGLSPAELVSHVLTRFVVTSSPVNSSRERVLARQELLLHAARQPALREPYRALAEASSQQFSALIADAMRYAGLDFTVPFPDALGLLTAAHDHMWTEALFTGAPNSRLLHTQLMAITRPV